MTQYDCFIDEPGLFNAPFFNMSLRESQAVDLQMRLALSLHTRRWSLLVMSAIASLSHSCNALVRTMAKLRTTTMSSTKAEG